MIVDSRHMNKIIDCIIYVNETVMMYSSPDHILNLQENIIMLIYSLSLNYNNISMKSFVTATSSRNDCKWAWYVRHLDNVNITVNKISTSRFERCHRPSCSQLYKPFHRLELSHFLYLFFSMCLYEFGLVSLIFELDKDSLFTSKTATAVLLAFTPPLELISCIRRKNCRWAMHSGLSVAVMWQCKHFL